MSEMWDAEDAVPADLLQSSSTLSGLAGDVPQGVQSEAHRRCMVFALSKASLMKLVGLMRHPSNPRDQQG